MSWSPGRIAVVVAAVLVPAAAIVIEIYGGEPFWPGVVAGFAATLVAVFLALELEGRRDRSRLQDDVEETNKRRTTEASKRLRALRKELKANRSSIGEIAKGLDLQTPGVFILLNPQLLDRAWLANSERLGDLLADHELMGDLAFFYGRVEELRWRMRFRTESGSDALDGMIRALVGNDELGGESIDLCDRVDAAAPTPEIRVVGPPSIVHSRAIGGATIVSVSPLPYEE